MMNNFFKNSLYYLLDLITFNKGIAREINGTKIRFPAKWSRYYPPDYEAENYLFLRQQVRPGMHIIDIGAHIGLFSANCSQLTGPSGRITCFEPTPGTFDILKTTLRLNRCDNVTPVQAAVSSEEGKAVFYVSDMEGCNSNSLVKNTRNGKPSGYEVQLITIDSYVAQSGLQPSLIKIDAEGAEYDVLKGGVQTFKKFKPILILGLHPEFIIQKGDSLEAIWDLLIEAGFRVHSGEQLLTKSDFCRPRDHFFDVHCIA